MDVDSIDTEPVIRGQDAARMLHISMRTLKNWIRSGYIKGKKIGGRWYVESGSLKDLLKFEQDKKTDRVSNDDYEQDLRMNW